MPTFELDNGRGDVWDDVELWLSEFGLGRYTAMLEAEGFDHFSIIRSIKEDKIDGLIKICGMPGLHAWQFREGLSRSEKMDAIPVRWAAW